MTLNDKRKELLNIDIEKYIGKYCFKANSLRKDILNMVEKQDKEFIRELKEADEEFLIRICGIIFADTGMDNTIECIKQAFINRKDKLNKRAGKELVE